MSLIKNIVAMGITMGLSNRDAFVDKISGYIKEYQEDPEKAEQYANALVMYLEEMKDNIRLQNSIQSSVKGAHLANKQDMEELTIAIKELAGEIQKLKNAK